MPKAPAPEASKRTMSLQIRITAEEREQLERIAIERSSPGHLLNPASLVREEIIERLLQPARAKRK